MPRVKIAGGILDSCGQVHCRLPGPQAQALQRVSCRVASDRDLAIDLKTAHRVNGRFIVNAGCFARIQTAFGKRLLNLNYAFGVNVYFSAACRGDGWDSAIIGAYLIAWLGRIQPSGQFSRIGRAIFENFYTIGNDRVISREFVNVG